jgi:hypothetical protein
VELVEDIFVFSQLRKHGNSRGPWMKRNIGSRGCGRLPGNPVAFTVVRLLAEAKEMNTSEIAKAAGRSVSRVSNILGALRLADVVRYETRGSSAQYRLKHPREIRKVLDALAAFVRSAYLTHR